MSEQKPFDIIIYGATGYTGRLVAEYMHTAHPGRAGRWAMAGRSADKLAAVRDEMGLPADTPLVVADASDPASLKAMADSAKVICTTVGPYTLYGEPLVAACVAAGTDYVDLCGEVLWMRQMIETHGERASETGARIVFSCGFDSIPFDLGVAFAQEATKAKTGQFAQRVRGRVRKMQGTFSGGTAASGKATMAMVQKDPSLMPALISPFGLTPGFEGGAQPKMNVPMEDDTIGAWVAPFFMAVINTKNVHRSNALLGHPYGTDFQYDEMIVTGPGEAGKAAAEAIASADPMGASGGPKPGEGPTKEEREAGHYDVLFVAETADGTRVHAGVTGDKDPGYGSTSKILAEAALYLADGHCEAAGGLHTPGSAFGTGLVAPLTERAGMTFQIEQS
ncbi:MAG: saccharopine dehydrogenase NADP-binding domain-containing protein [Pseudomonadota bacterium]